MLEWLRFLSKKSKKVHYEPQIYVGKHTYGHENIRTAWGEGAVVEIGSFTSIAANLNLQLGGNHNQQWISTFPFGHVRENEKVLFPPPLLNHPVAPKSVYIGNDVWIGNNVTIMGGARIGDGAIVAMNSHVVGEIGAYEVYGGNPARKIKDRFSRDIIELLCELKWWNEEDLKIERIKHLLSDEPTVELISEIKMILGKVQ